MKKLGIVLPTYNRAKYALEGIQALMPQLLHNSDRTCLLISDNASTDDTEKVLKPFAEKYPDIIRYVKQSENIGPHANFYFGIKNIDAEYVYLLGDDDLVSPNFIDIILNILDNNQDVGIVHMNYLEGPEDLKEVSIHHRHINNIRLIKIFNEGTEFIKEMLISPSFISSNVFRRDCMLEGLKSNYHEDCYGYDWLVCLYTGLVNKKCLFYNLPLVVQRWGSPYPRFALNTLLGQQRVFDYMDPYIPGTSELWRNHVSSMYSTLSVIRTICADKKLYKPYYKEINSCLRSRVHRFSLLSALFLPSVIGKIIIDIFKIVSKLGKKFSK